MSRRQPLIVIALLLFGTVAIPPAVYMAFKTSSMAVGVLIVAAIHGSLLVTSSILAHKSQGIGPIILPAIVVASLIFIHGAISFFINREVDYGRFWQSVVFLVAFALGAYSLARLARTVSANQVNFAARFVFLALVTTGFASLFGFAPIPSVHYAKPVVFFTEPSLFALSFLPFLLYMVVTSRRSLKLLFVLISLALALLLQNLTFILGIIVCTIFIFPPRQLLIVVPVIVAPLVAADFNLDYYLSRINISSESDNISVLAFLQGWERAYLNLEDFFGFGVGFQQFGVFGRLGQVVESMEALGIGGLNLYDGGSVGSKFIGEFGAIGVVALLIYLAKVSGRFRWLHGVSLRVDRFADRRRIFFACCFIMYSVDLFFRGSGYFSPTGFLFLTSILWFAFEPQDARGRTAHPHQAILQPDTR